MDGNEHDHRPLKRLRLENTHVSGSLLSRSFQSSEYRDHGVYNQVPLINPFVSTSETDCHMTADYNSGQCRGSIHQITTTSGSDLSPWQSTLSTAPETSRATSPECSNELSTKDPMDQVCFGMLDDIPVHLLSNSLDTASFPIHFIAGSEIVQLQKSCGTIVGELTPHYSKVIRVLQDGESIELQATFVPSSSRHGIPRQPRNRGRKAAQLQARLPTLSLILYGSMVIFESIRDFLTQCSEYLQPPLRCDRNVPYCNPQSLIREEKNLQMTSQLQGDISHSEVEALVRSIDPSALLESEDLNSEAEAPAALKSSLYSHQKRALSFMLMRERGMRDSNEQTERWRAFFDETDGVTKHVNTVTGIVCDFRPVEVKGGILADSMGLGKSLSMISLLASEWPDYSSGPSELVPTLIVVPPSLVRTWEDELRRHLRPGTLRCWLYHGPKRAEDMVSMLAHDIVVTTYDVVATEWKSVEKGPRPLFLVNWRRIVLDEGKLLCLQSIPQADSGLLAHEIRVGTTLRAKAICALRGHFRWVVSGTPIQNRWEDLASLLNFLRVYPDNDLRSITTMLRHSAANSALRNMMASFCLRRSKQAIDIPSRRDTTHKVDFDAEEAANYKNINLRVTGFLEQEANQTNMRSYSNILTRINALRQICNLGTLYQGKKGEPENLTAGMQQLFDGMISAGTALCCKCEKDLSEADEGDELGSRGINDIELSKIRMFTCGQVICASCFTISGMIMCPSDGRCQYQSLCKIFTVTSSSSSDLPEVKPSSRLPTKMRALQKDLLALPETDKSIIFSFWTSTLDVAEVALDQINMSYTRVDGTMLAKQRQLALESFVGDPRIRTILISLRCGSNGLNLTAANHVFLMEPQWNPMVEDQALDRVHRIGQTKEVTTVRYIVKNTLEQSIRHQQSKKRKLAEQAFALAKGHNDWMERMREMLSNVP